MPSHDDPSPPFDDKDPERRRLERVLPELVKRLVENGYERLTEGPENLRQRVQDFKLPKELVQLVLAQLEETKGGVYRVVARELHDFLDNTSLSDELGRALKNFSLEVKTQIRFVPNDPPEPKRTSEPDDKGAEDPDGHASSSPPDDELPQEKPPT